MSKKKNPFVKFLLSILIILLILILIITSWFIYSAFDRQKLSQVVPNDYSIYVRCDSAWDAFEPLLDLKAVDLVVAEPSLSAIRPFILNFRKSHLRSSFLVKKLLQRRIDIALYEDKSFLCVANMGFLSGITRLAPLITDIKKIENLTYVKTNVDNFFIYKNQNQLFYIMPYKNLVIITGSEDLFKKAVSFTNEESYSQKQLQPLTEKLKEPFKISCNSEKLLKMLSETSAEEDLKDAYLHGLSDAVTLEELSTISLEISESDVHVKLNLPYKLNEAYQEHPLSLLFKQESTTPSLLNKIPENTQYYTFINSLSIEQLKNAAFALIPSSYKLEDKWQMAEKASNVVFHTSLEDAVFSWTDDEFSVFALEGKSEPVLAIKISDEKKRQQIFDTLFSSIILTSDKSLLVDSVRLPTIQLPGYLQSILETFGIYLPKPYYIVRDDFIYFSQSPENLVSINNAGHNNKRITNSQNWKHLSNKMSPLSTVSLYYNLERSIPFFLKSKTTVSEVLKLYNIGRFDLSLKNNEIYVQLKATVSKSEYSPVISGFPKSTKKASQLCKSNDSKFNTIFYLEGKDSLSALSPQTLSVNTKQIKDIDWLIPASPATIKSCQGELWAISKNGTIYLLTKELEIVKGFPFFSDKICAKPALYKDQLLFTTTSGYISMVSSEATETYFENNYSSTVQYTPGVKDDYYAIYERGFLGGIHLYKGTEIAKTSGLNPFIVEGLGYTSPCLFKKGGNIYIAFITQTGLLYILDKNLTPLKNFPLQLDGLFYVDLKEADGNIFALSAEGSLFKITQDANFTQIEIPYLKAKQGVITTCDYNGDNHTDIFVSGEGNTVYGFTSLLEMIEAFPLSGYNELVFTDVNGDKKDDCLVLSIDDHIFAYNIF